MPMSYNNDRRYHVICHLSDCLKINGGWGFAPDPTGGAYSALTEPLTTFKGSYIKGRGGEGGEGKGKRKVRERRGEGQKEMSW